MHIHADVTPQLACAILLNWHRGQLLWVLELNGNWEQESSPSLFPAPWPGGWAVVIYLPLQVTLQGALTSLRDGEGLRSGVGGQRRHYSLLQVPNWKLLEASPLSGGSLSVSG